MKAFTIHEQQVYDDIISHINFTKATDKNIYLVDDQLMSIRKLCLFKNISFNSAKKIYKKLIAGNLIYSKKKQGYYIKY